MKALDGTTVRHSDTITEIAGALAASQLEMKNPPKDSVSPHYKSRYADLATVRDAVLPVFNRHGLAVLQLACETADGPALTTMLLHKSGEWFEATLLLRAQQQTPQGIGSALTYCRRYALQSLAGVAADDDDDGNAGAKPANPQPKPEPAPVAAPAIKRPEPAPAPKNLPATPAGFDFDRLMTEAPELTRLARLKGWDYAKIIQSLNKKYRTTYNLMRTNWSDVMVEHRESVVAVLLAMPDVAEGGAK